MFRQSASPFLANSSRRIPSSNGLSYSSGRTIIIELPEDLGFISPSESYVNLDFAISTGDTHRPYLVAREDGGISSVIESVRVYSARNGALLESIQDYGSLVSAILHNSTNEPHKAKLSATEGVGQGFDVVGNTFFDDVTPADEKPTWRTCTYALRLHGLGIFNDYYGKAIPVSQFGGLRIEIDTVRDVRKALQRLNGISTGLNNTNGNFNESSQVGQPYYLKLDMTDGNLADDDTKVFIGAGQSYPAIPQSNNKQSPTLMNVNGGSNNSFPIRIGEAVGVVQVDKVNGNQVLSVGAGAGSVITAITTNNSGSYAGGNMVWEIDIDAWSGGVADPSLYDYYLVAVDGRSGTTLEQTLGLLAQQTTFTDATENNVPKTVIDSVEFTVSNINFIANQLNPDKNYTDAMKKGSMNYRFKTYQTYKVNIPQAISSGATPVPITNSRVFGIYAQPCTQENFTDASYSDQSVLCGLRDTAQRFQYQIGGTLYPDRKCEIVPVKQAQIQSSQYFYELMKCLRSCDREIRNVENQEEHFLLPVALGKDDFAFDMRGKDCLLFTDYEAPAVDKLVKVFVCCEVNIGVSPSGIDVQR